MVSIEDCGGWRRSAAVVLAAVLFGLSSAGADAAEERDYLLATASVGGTYYPVGVAIATLVKVKLQAEHKIGMSAINSAGSEQNIGLLREDEAQFAILQGLYGHYAWSGTGPLQADGAQTGLRSISMLWQNVEQITVRSEFAKSGTVADLAAMKGKKMAMGKQNSGAIGSTRYLLDKLGIDIDSDFELVDLPYDASALALQEGRVQGMSTPGGTPTIAVSRAFAALGDKITLLGFSDREMERADGGLGLWSRHEIEADTYPGQKAAIDTIAQPNFLAVRADIDEETVYLITKTMYENLPFLYAIHDATEVMDIGDAITGLPVPLHPGAARYYREVGIEIPEDLIPR